MITGEFNPRLKEHLLDLGGKFTTVELESLLTLKNAHSQRLFWIMRSYHNQKWEEALPFETLREWLFGENSEQYTDWTDFNRYVLKPAIEEFRTIGWEVQVTVRKRGRRVETLLFELVNHNAKVVAELSTSKKSLSLVEIAEFRTQLAAKYQELSALYDRMRSDFEFKEYQAREVVTHINNMDDFRAVNKALHEVLLDLSDKKPIKLLPAFALSKIKAVLPVYQQKPAPPTVLTPSKTRRGRERPQVEEELRETQYTLDFMASEEANGLYSPSEQQERQRELKDRIINLHQELA